MNVLDGIPLVELTPSVLLGLAVLFVMLGRLVPRSILQDKKEEAEKWRKAYEAERDARALSDSQTSELLELAKTDHNILIAMFGSAEARGRHSGGPNVVQTQR